jgi:DDE domain
MTEPKFSAPTPPAHPRRHRQLGRAVRGWKDRLTALELWRGGLVGTEKPSYKGFRFPAEIISHCVWLYHRFPLSLREVEEMMLQRGVTVSHESIRQWCATFGQTYANALRRRRARPGDKWHLDEMFITINGKTHYLWRAVDQHGTVLDILVTSRRDAKAAMRFFRKLFTGLEYRGCWSPTSWAATKRRGAGLPARSSTASRSI